jgi:hypothetical protein
MLEPSTTEGWRIQGELKNLLEDVTVRRAESSVSRRQGYPRSITPRLSDSCGKPRSTPGARGMQRLQPQVDSATSTTAATIEPTSTRRCAEATSLGVRDAMTAGRIEAPRPNHLVRKLSAGPYDGRRSRPGSEPRLPSPSTRGKQGRNYGSRTTGWPASWVGQMMTTSLSAFRDRGVPGPTSECRRVPQPRWVDARPSAKGEVRWPETGVREVEISRPSCPSRAQVGCACSSGLQASTRERERAALSERLSRPRPRAANPF